MKYTMKPSVKPHLTTLTSETLRRNNNQDFSVVRVGGRCDQISWLTRV